MTDTAHLAVYDTLADWEVGHLLAELRTGRFTGTPFEVVTVAESREPITTMGGVRIVPDRALADLDPADSDAADPARRATLWDAGGGTRVRRRPRRGSWTPACRSPRSAARRPGWRRPACWTSARHTSAAAEYLAATGYAGGEHYVDERAVVDGDLITAGPQSPVQFARATLRASRAGVRRRRSTRTRRCSTAATPSALPGADGRPRPREPPGCARRRVPPRGGWPEPPPQTEAGALLTELVLATFRLNARLMDAAQALAAAGGITAAWWQVLGGVLDEPRSVAEIGRRMGMTPPGRAARRRPAGRARAWRSTGRTPRTGAPSCWPAPRPATGRSARSRSASTRGPTGSAEAVGADELRAALATMRRLIETLD